MKFYKTEELKETVENSDAFAGTFPKEASLETVSANVRLEEVAAQLLKQYQSEAVAGVELHSINFTVILKPEEK